MLGLYWGTIRVMYWDHIGGSMGIMEKKMETGVVLGYYIGITENEMETTYLGFRF